MKISKRLQRGDGSRYPFAVSLCIYSAFAHPQVLCFYGATSFEAPKEHLAAEVCEESAVSLCVYSVFRHPTFEAQNEHLAAEVCEVTVWCVRFDYYLQRLRKAMLKTSKRLQRGNGLR